MLDIKGITTFDPIPFDCYYIISSFLINNGNLKLTCRDVYTNCVFDDRDIYWAQKYTSFMKNNPIALKYDVNTDTFKYIMNNSRLIYHKLPRQKIKNKKQHYIENN